MMSTDGGLLKRATAIAQALHDFTVRDRTVTDVRCERFKCPHLACATGRDARVCAAHDYQDGVSLVAQAFHVLESPCTPGVVDDLERAIKAAVRVLDDAHGESLIL